ncbi:MAG: autotransporter-associated beta strand repeat-containing protein [Chthoniobacteraceae bacterium]
MNRFQKPGISLKIAGWAALMMVILGCGAQAQTSDTWTGPGGTTSSPTSGAWDNSTTGNWSTAGAWGAGDNAIFGGTASPGTTVTVGAAISATSLEFTNANDNYTLSAASPETVTVNASTGSGNPSSTADIEIVASGTATIGSNVTINKTSNNGFEIAGTVFGSSASAGTLNVNGAITMDPGTNASNGNILIDGGITVNVNTGGSISSSFTGNGSNQNFQIGRDENGSSIVNIDGGSLTSDAAAGMFLGRNDKSYTGTQTLNINSGTVTLGDLAITKGTLNLNGGTLSAGTASDSGQVIGNGAAGGITASGGTSIFNFNGGTLEASGASTSFMTSLNTASVESGGAIINPNTFAITISQALLTGGGTDGGLTVSGAGTLTLSGANTYNGGTTVNAGTLTISGAGTLGTPTGALTVNTTGGASVLNLNTGAGTTAGSLNGAVSGGGTATINAANGENLTVNQTTAGSYAGVIAGPTSGFVLGASSTSELTLSGMNTYGGGTTVNGGKLGVTGSLLSTGGLTVGAGGTFALGEGAGGGSFLSQTISTLSLTSGGQQAALALNIGTGTSSDFLDATGAFTLSGSSFNLDINGTSSGSTYDLLEWDATGSSAITTSNVDLLLDGSNLGVGSSDLSIVSSGGNDILELTTAAVPEPSTYAMVLGGLGLFLVLRRKRLGRVSVGH